MIPGGFVDDTILRIAQRAGELDNISRSRTSNNGYYGMFYHRIFDLIFLRANEPDLIGRSGPPHNEGF
jgi:hypothetical protein